MDTQSFDESAHPRGEGGQFATKPATEADVALTPSGVPLGRDVGVGAPAGLGLQAVVDDQDKILADAWEKKVELDRRITRAGLAGACATMRQRYPQVASVTLGDNDEGGVTWRAHDADDQEINIEDDDELSDTLYEYGSHLEMDRARRLAEFARGYDPDRPYGYSGDIEVDKHTGIVESITVDVDAMLTGARVHA